MQSEHGYAQGAQTPPAAAETADIPQLVKETDLSLLFKRDADPTQFVREAQRFLSAVRRGHDDETAAKRARTTVAQVRIWMREPAFAQEYRQSKSGRGRGARVINLGTVDMSEQERIEQLERARQRIAELGYRTDEFGRVLPW